MNCQNTITTNAGGFPYISSTNVTVGTESVDIALGFRSIQPIGYLTIRMAAQIPDGTTATLPITLTLNGTTRSLTLPNGSAATAGDLESVLAFTVFNDRFNGLLLLMSRTTV